MLHHEHGTPPRQPLGRRVPGLLCSLLIAVLCLGASALLAWQHPLVELRCAPRRQQPPINGGDSRIIVDGTLTRRLWGLFTVGREELRNVTHFTMRSSTAAKGAHVESLHVMTSGGSRVIAGDESSSLLPLVAQLNSQLDRSPPETLTLRRTQWPWFTASWVLLVLGVLVLLRNVIIAPWRRRQWRLRQLRGERSARKRIVA